ELRLSGDQGTASEAAFSVEPGWRRRGVGKELMARMARAASNARVTTLHMSCLASNRPMQKLAKHFEADIKFEADQVTGRMIGRPSDGVEEARSPWIEGCPKNGHGTFSKSESRKGEFRVGAESVVSGTPRRPDGREAA